MRKFPAVGSLFKWPKNGLGLVQAYARRQEVHPGLLGGLQWPTSSGPDACSRRYLGPDSQPWLPEGIPDCSMVIVLFHLSPKLITSTSFFHH